MAADNTTNSDRRLVGIGKLQKRLPMHATTFWRWIRDGKFPRPVYIGTRRYWDLAEVERWETENLRAAPAK